ncbi:Hypothetical predicted protein [Mytilus galloprovincialis]|nr:Hypothetical predicted protein [Mytilus galloprovincialis]
MCLVTFSVIEKTHSLPTTLYAIPYPQNYTCTDCCDLLTCMGPGKKITSDLFELLCSKTSVATSPTCYTEHNLNHCSYTEKVVSILPSTVMNAEFFTQFCKQREELQAVMFCLKNSSEGEDAINRCSSPYMYDLTYIFNDICEKTTKLMTMLRCVLSVIKIANCSGTFSRNYEQLLKLRIEETPYCANQSAQMCKELYLVIMSLVLIWNKISEI